MADDRAWADKGTLLSLHQNLRGCLNNYKIFFEELKKFKQEVIDDPARKAEFMKLINELDGWDIDKITNKYLEHKTIYEYLEGV